MIKFYQTNVDVNPIHYGFELECEFKNYQGVDTRDLLGERIDEVVGPNQLIYKPDGSLPYGGIEIVSEPMTLNYLRANEIFEKLETFKTDLIGITSRS